MEMKENTVELFDYLRVIWKRKILIIVVTLVCIGIGVAVGVGVKNLRSKLPPVTSYQASAVIRIGKKVVLTPSLNIASSTTAYVESPEDLKETIPHRYGLNISEASGYHLEARQIGQLSMLRLILKGPDKGVEKILKGIINMLVDEHRKIANASIVSYTNFIKKLDADAKMFQENITIIDASIKEIKRREEMYLENMVAAEAEPQKDKSGGGQSAFLNMLYLKTLDKEKDLSNNRANLRNTQWQLILYKSTIGSLVEFDTELLGNIKSTAIESKKGRSPISTIIVAGVAGLIMSLFIAFFMEYIKESASRRKGK
jgi:hypothetical protein